MARCCFATRYLLRAASPRLYVATADTLMARDARMTRSELAKNFGAKIFGGKRRRIISASASSPRHRAISIMTARR